MSGLLKVTKSAEDLKVREIPCRAAAFEALHVIDFKATRPLTLPATKPVSLKDRPPDPFPAMI